MNVFELFAKISLDTSSYEKGLTGAEKSTSSFGDKLKKGIGVAAGVATAAIGATTAVVGASAKAFLNGAKQVSDFGDNVDKQSQRLGISAEKFQELDYVMNIAGTSMNNMTMGMKTMTNQLDAAKKGNKEAIDNFKKLGISMNDIKTMSREDLFEKSIKGFQNMSDSTSRAALANKLFGRSGQELTPLFNMTNEQTEELIAKSREYGMVMSSDNVKASANFKDSLTTLQNTMTGLKNNMMSNFLPSLTTITDGLSAVFSGKNTEEGMSKISSGLSSLLSDLNKQAPKFMALAKTIITSLLQGFAPMLPSLVSTIFDIAIKAITTISSMIPSMMPSIISGIQGIMSALMSALPIVIDGISQLVMALATWLSEGDNVSLIVNGLVQLCSQIVNSIAMLLPVLIPMIATIIGELANAMSEPDNVQMLLDAILTIIGALAVGIWNALPILAKAVWNVLQNLGELLGRFFDFAVPIAEQGIEFIVNTVKSWGNNIKNFVLNLINGIRNSITTWISNLKQGFLDGFNFIRDSIANIIGKVSSLVSDIIGKLKELPSKVVSIGSDLIKGLWNGISNMTKWIGDKIKGFGKNVTDKLKDFFKIKSPSRLFRDEIGQMLALGLGEGFERGMDNTVSEMVSSARNATSEIADAMSGSSLSMSAVGAAQTGSVLNAGGFTINVYGAEGQDVRALARAVSEELQNMVNDKRKAYGL